MAHLYMRQPDQQPLQNPIHISPLTPSRIKFALPYKVITFNKDFEVSMVAYSTREIF